MEILGIGGWELVAILLIMLVVAGPKRMIAWSYTLGRYVSMLRRMWAETAAMLQKELDEAGVDVKVPTEPPTRGNIQREVTRAFSGVTKPLQETLDQVNTEIEPARQATMTPRTLNKPVSRSTAPESPRPAESSPTSNGTAPAAPPESDFGTWTQSSDS